MKKRDTPAIRHKNFNHPWEQREVSTFCYISTGQSNTQDKIDNGLYPFYVRSPNVERSHKYLFDEEAVLTVGDGVGTGRVFHYVNGKYDLHQRVYRIYGFDNRVNAKFFYYAFSLQFYNRVMAWTAKTSVDSVRLEMISDMPIKIPSLSEQESLSKLFSLYDTAITIHKRKLSKIKATKSFLLEKMFPKNGSDVPEIRLKGFTDPWEQRQLGEVVNVYDGVHQTPDYKNEGIMFLSVENITTLKSEKFISQEAFARDYKVYPQKGDILMTRIGDVGTPNVVETTEQVAFYVSLALLKPRKIDSYFLCNSIQSPFFQSGLKNRSLTTAIPQKINKDEIGKVGIIVPAQLEEQHLIGSLLNQYDTAITMYQRKVEKLENMKQALLEKMFV